MNNQVITFERVICPICKADDYKMYVRDYCFKCIAEFETWRTSRDLDMFERYKAENNRGENIYYTTASAISDPNNKVTIAPDVKIEVQYVGADNS